MFSALIKLQKAHRGKRSASSHKTMSGVLRSIATRQQRAALRSDLHFSKKEEEEEDSRPAEQDF